VIRVEGVLEKSACLEFERVLTQAEASGAARILLDIDRVDSLDARALHVVLRASRRAACDGNRLQVTRGKGHVANIFRLAALDQTPPFVDESRSF